MLDGIDLERAGVPTVTVTWDRFAPAARAQAAAAGMPALPLVVMAEPRLSDPSETLEAEAERTLPEMIRALTAS